MRARCLAVAPVAEPAARAGPVPRGGPGVGRARGRREAAVPAALGLPRRPRAAGRLPAGGRAGAVRGAAGAAARLVRARARRRRGALLRRAAGRRARRLRRRRPREGQRHPPGQGRRRSEAAAPAEDRRRGPAPRAGGRRAQRAAPGRRRGRPPSLRAGQARSRGRRPRRHRQRLHCGLLRAQSQGEEGGADPERPAQRAPALGREAGGGQRREACHRHRVLPAPGTGSAQQKQQSLQRGRAARL
nr:small nuclear ribonucleoprotein-associated protein B'-like [Oryctolagus cuniculus]